MHTDTKTGQWQIVPTEPTPAMLSAAFDGMVTDMDAMRHAARTKEVAATYARMLAAAPSTSAADMFWDSEDEDNVQTSLAEILSTADSNRTLVAGAELRVERAIRLPDLLLRVMAIPEDGDIEYEIIKGGA